MLKYFPFPPFLATPAGAGRGWLSGDAPGRVSPRLQPGPWCSSASGRWERIDGCFNAGIMTAARADSRPLHFHGDGTTRQPPKGKTRGVGGRGESCWGSILEETSPPPSPPQGSRTSPLRTLISYGPVLPPHLPPPGTKALEKVIFPQLQLNLCSAVLFSEEMWV